jgi:hypothetical protein
MKEPEGSGEKAEGSGQKAEAKGFLLLVPGGHCLECGWNYPVYHGHIEPCPRCGMAKARARLALVEGVLDRIHPAWREWDTVKLGLPPFRPSG